ncbi:MAG: ABC transporter permease [Microbacteriaceae bacterium]
MRNPSISSSRTWPRFFTSWEAIVGAGLLAATVAVIAFGPAFAPYSPTDVGIGIPNSGPSSDHLLGTDWLGRDVLSRFLSGGREVLLIPFLAATVAYVIGGFLGILGALHGGVLDGAISRSFDVMLVLPPMLLGLVILGSAGSSRLALVLLLVLVVLPRAGRVIRGSAQGSIGSDYVHAAVSRGESRIFIVGREVLPNIALPVLSDFGVRLTYTIIFAASLSFLGFGAQPPTPDWGRMVSDSVPTVSVAPVPVLVATLGIAVAAISINLLAEGIGRLSEPSTKRKAKPPKAAIVDVTPSEAPSGLDEREECGR